MFQPLATIYTFLMFSGMVEGGLCTWYENETWSNNKLS